MKKFLATCLALSIVSFSFAQGLIKGLPITISLVPKSARQPTLRLKDGSNITLAYKAESGIHVVMGKNGKTWDFCDPISNTKLVEVGQTDIENDGKPEVVVVDKTSDATIEVHVYKKAEFETLYKQWSNFTGVSAVEFPGNGMVKLYDRSGNAGIYKFADDGKITEAQ